MNILDFLNQLIAKGYCSFSFAQAKEALGVSDIAARAALRRLKQKGELAQPLSGFYVIVPPEYRVLGCRPAEHFIHDLMLHIGVPYYVGLLSAAQYYGAAHHRPQQFQVIINQKRRAITCGRIKIVFVTKKNIDVPIENFNTSHGVFKISSLEATAMDMVTYPHHCGGFDNVLTVLAELARKLNADKLSQLASNTDEVTWVQRLGYLLDILKLNSLSDVLLKSIENRRVHFRVFMAPPKKSSALNKLTARLQSRESSAAYEIKNAKWKLIINNKLEIEK